MIFVVGCGRTGTHWIARSLAKSLDAPLVGEDDPLFETSVRAALRPAERSKLLNTMVAQYRQKPEFCVDKCHPNLWFAPELAVRVPLARFVLTRRNLLDVVRSMLDHPGTLRWIRELNHYDQTCEPGFLGRVDGLCLEGRTLAAGCAARIIAHLRRIEELEPGLPRCAVFDYDEAVRRPQSVAARLTTELTLPKPLELEPPRTRRHAALTSRELDDVAWVAGTLGWP